MNIVFCADRSVLPGLHVAVYSLLERISPAVGQTRFFVFSDSLDDEDIGLLRQTLAGLNKPFELELRRVDAARFAGFPSLNGSWATYYRLSVPELLEVDRFLYVDADTLCDTDVSEVQRIEMQSFPAGWVSEAPLPLAVDRQVADQLGNKKDDFYFNAGVMLFNVPEWRRQKITDKAMSYIAAHRPQFHDQSAFNVVLHGNVSELDSKFNCMSNMRKNWPALTAPYGKIGKLVHFLDYPKPWDWLGELVHPQYRLWRSVLEKTAMKDFRSWHNTPARKLPRNQKAFGGYKKIIKDRILFSGYSKAWLKNVKGIRDDSFVS
ncbi:MAG TPA: glycosyltransferase family 8 protein [Verrucomicrobiae bacterium]|jgi:lipopolysaccharide biosynthesis glycosyltransferase